jgi:hypothetical protein
MPVLSPRRVDVEARAARIGTFLDLLNVGSGKKVEQIGG